MPDATSYHVWFTDIGKVVATRTNAVDEREFYSFHRASAYIGAVHWRVRAVRTMYGTIPSSLPRVTYGPWSKVNTSKNPNVSSGPLKLVSAVSDDGTESTPGAARVHRLTPAFTFSGDQVGGTSYTLFRAYVFSDSQCVNVIYRGTIVEPELRPRTTGPLALAAKLRRSARGGNRIPSRRSGRQDVHGRHRKRADDRERQAAAAAAAPAEARSTATTPVPGADLAPLPSLPALTGAPSTCGIAVGPTALLLDGRSRLGAHWRTQSRRSSRVEAPRARSRSLCLDHGHLEGIDAQHRLGRQRRAGARRLRHRVES